MIATKTLLLMVMWLAGGENGGKAKNCRVLAWYIGILLLRGVAGNWYRIRTPKTVPQHWTFVNPDIKQIFYLWHGLLIMLYKVVLTFASVDVVLKCDHATKRYWGSFCWTRLFISCTATVKLKSLEFHCPVSDTEDFKIGHYGRLGRLDRCRVTKNTCDLLPDWYSSYKIRNSPSVIEPSAKEITSEFRTWPHRPLFCCPILTWKFSRLLTVMAPGRPYTHLTVPAYRRL